MSKNTTSVTNSRFLDDQLFDCATKATLRSLNDITSLVNELYRITENKFKPQLDIDMPTREAKMILDRTFKSWDLCINRLAVKHIGLASLMEACHFKKAFLENEKNKSLYNNL